MKSVLPKRGAWPCLRVSIIGLLIIAGFAWSLIILRSEMRKREYSEVLPVGVKLSSNVPLPPEKIWNTRDISIDWLLTDIVPIKRQQIPIFWKRDPDGTYNSAPGELNRSLENTLIQLGAYCEDHKLYDKDGVEILICKRETNPLHQEGLLFHKREELKTKYTIIEIGPEMPTK
jgi:hypothetical protein